MKRRIVLGFLISLFSLITSWMILAVEEKLQRKVQARVILKHLPAGPFLGVDSLAMRLDTVKARRKVVIFFDPACDICQQEAAEFAVTKVQTDMRIFWVSASSIKSAKEFGVRFDLLGRRDMGFCMLNRDQVLETFGSLQIPHIFIYDKGNLVKEFKGETKIDLILSSVP